MKLMMTDIAWSRVRVRAASAIACTLMLLGLSGAAEADRGRDRDRDRDALGEEVVVFGPRTYQRGTGAPKVVSEQVVVPGGVAGPWLLRLQNGTPQGRGWRDTVSAGALTINGVQFVGPNEFNREDNLIEKSVELSPTNKIELRLAGRPGGAVSLTLIGHKPRPVPVAIEPQQLRLANGAIGQMSVRLAPIPSAPGSIVIRADEARVVGVPASASFAAGQERVPFNVEARGYGRSDIVARLNGHSVEGSVRVTRQAVGISTLAPSTLELARGTNGRLTITLSAASSRSTTVSLESSQRSVATVPSSVTIEAGRKSADVAVSAIGTGIANISARLRDSHAVSRIHVVPALARVVSLLPVTSTLTLGAQSELQLNLSAAQASPTTIALAATPTDVISVPSQMVVPGGQIAAAVPVTAVGIGTAGLTATLNGSSATAAVQVQPPAPTVTALTPAILTLRQDATGILRASLNAAQTAATEIAVTVDSQFVRAPASVTVPAGQNGVDIPVTGLAIGQATVSAQVGDGLAQTADVSVIPLAPAPVSLLPNPLSIQQGASGQFILTINAAQFDDTTVSVATNAPDIVFVPPQVVVPAGSNAVAIGISGLAAGTASLTATVNGQAISADIVVAPPPPGVSGLDPVVLSLPKGVPGRLSVQLSRAPVVDTTVSVISSDPLVAEVPATVTVAAGALIADLPVLARSEGVAEISASLNGAQAASRVTVTAPELVKLTISPQSPLAYVGESVAFLANGTYTDAATRDMTGTVAWSSSNAAVATVASTGVLTAIAEGETTLGAVSGTVAASTVVAVQKLPTLSFAPAAASLKSGDSLYVTVISSVPADAGGLPVALGVSGPGGLDVAASVTLPAGQTSASFSITGQGVGAATLTATAQRRVPANLQVNVLPKISITALTPQSGPVGSPVTIRGTNFDTNAAGNEVRFNGERAVVGSATANELKVIVPVRATTGFVTVTTSLGTASSPEPFTVERQHQFDISLSPETVQAPVGGFASVRIRLQSTGLVQYAHAATVSLQGLPNGVTATLERPTVYVGGETTALINIPATLAAGTYTVVVSATGQTETGSLTRTKPVNIEVLAAVTTVTGRVLHAEDDSPFVGARIRLGGQAVVTDASGYYRFVNPTVLGDQVLLIDGHTANTATAEYPSAIALPVMIVAGSDNLPLTSFIQAIDPSKFAAVTPGAKTDVTMMELPNYALNIPQGAILYGWDGTPVTKINVRSVPVDRLPIKPVPAGVTAKSVYLYYFFREGGANPTQPIPVTMANDLGALPGEKADLWYYDESTTPDANSNQWRIMGQGTVTADGKSIVSDPGVGIPKFCCGASLASPAPPPQPPASCPDGGPQSSNPVVYGTGAATVMEDHSLGLNGLFPVRLGCSYNSLTDRIGPFGRGTSLNTEWQLAPGSESIVLMSPAGHRWILAKDGAVFRTLPGRTGAYGVEAWIEGAKTVVRFPEGTQYEFSGFGRGNQTLVAQQDTSGNRITLTRSSVGLLQSITDAGGRLWRIDYAGSLISKLTDPLGRTLSFAYDASSRLTQVTDTAGNATQYAYDAAHRIVQKTTPSGAATRYDYDSAGRAVKETFADATAYGFNYTVSGNMVMATQVTDPRGNVERWRFNGLGDWVRSEDALGRIASRKLDLATNLVLAETDTAGRTTRHTYDAKGNRTSTRDPQDNLTLFEYGPVNNKLTAITDPLGNKTLFTYDAQARLTGITDPTGATVANTWTASGLLASRTDALGHQTTYAYDSEGNLLSLTDPLGQVSEFSYDSANRLIKSVDPLGLSSRRSWDALDRLTEATDAHGGITQLTYDAEHRLTSVTDPRGNPVERNAYDARGRLTQRQDAAGLATSLKYDPAGNLIQSTDRKGRITVFDYDALNRPTRREDPDGRITGWEYDLAGNIAAIRDNQTGDLLFAYDTLNRPTRIVTDQGTLDYQYDALGRRTQRTVNGSDAVTYQYDKASRLTQMTYRGRNTTYAWDKAGRLTEKTLPNGLKQTYVWDAASRLTSTTLTKPDGTAIETIAYEYDASGRRTARSATVTDVPETPIDASYDNSNRLTTVTISGQPYAMTYDANGNLTKKTGTGTTNVNDVTTYTWDARNQLAALQKPGVTASFKYDALGRRTEKTINGDSVQYLYDGQQAIAEIRGSAITATYLTGLAIDEVIARYTAQGERSLLTDALGSVILAAKEDGTVQTAYGYSPYGETQVMGTEEGNPVQYTARENDGTGLYYYRARYYDPVLKQWSSEDPIGITGGLNVYSYVGGNPISRRDPTGLEFEKEMGGGANRPPSENLCTLSPDIYPEACRRHDQCYRDACKSRKQCDNEFLRDMRREQGPWGPETVPVVYWGAVRLFGRSFYGTP